MLTELYRYALDKGLAAQPGFKPKRVKAYVLLSASGEFLGIHTGKRTPRRSMRRTSVRRPTEPDTAIP